MAVTLCCDENLKDGIKYLSVSVLSLILGSVPLHRPLLLLTTNKVRYLNLEPVRLKMVKD